MGAHMSKVAVIGCGAFGGSIALKLRGIGARVTVFERLPTVLGGASYNNQNRLHLGYHYPRDFHTAAQSAKGFRDFQDWFPDCCAAEFPNAYFIANENSRTTPAGFLSFCERVGLPFKEVDPDQFLPTVKRVSLGIVTGERVYDSTRMRAALEARLLKAGVELRLGVEVERARQVGSALELHVSAGVPAKFDFVVNATYAASSHISASLGLPLPQRQYEYTVVPIIKAPFARVGITVMDGPFMTILPFGDESDHLLYHVDHSVIARDVGTHLDKRWLEKTSSPFASCDPMRVFRAMIEDSAPYIPALKNSEPIGFLHGPRMVLANRDDTDARPSLVERLLPNYVTVFSGKVDHCIGVAETVCEMVADVAKV